MSRTLYPTTQYGKFADKKTIRGEMMDSATLRQGNEITIWSKKVPADKVFTWGYGPDSKKSGAEAFVYAELLASGAGALTDGDQLTGDLVLAVTDSTQEDVLARRNVGDLQTLADAKADDRTERPIVGELSPGATEDRFLELRVIADSGSDGAEVAQDSNVRLFYGSADN
jgi:hypothetical protein